MRGAPEAKCLCGTGLECGDIQDTVPECFIIGEMKPSELLSKHRHTIRAIALRHRAADVLVFGSALSGKDHEQSDLDLLIQPTAHTSLMDIGAIQFEVSELLGIAVDVLTPNALPEHFRHQVLRDARPV